jgi:putative nucleotidyltransferase with HDIG domain
MPALDHYLDRVKNLPPAPTVAIQLLDLFSDPDRDIDRIVELISVDPALTAETLRRCNHRCLGDDEPVTEMFEAVTQLGFYEVYCVVAALIGSRSMTLIRAKYDVDATRLWQHSVTTAVIASILAKRVQVVEATAFTAGLLHDLGKLVLTAVDGITYFELSRRTGGFGPALAAAEESALGFDHAALGARLLARWGLPQNVCLAVSFHHQSPAAAGSSQRLAATVNFANCLAHEIIDGLAKAPSAAEVSPEAMDLVELTPKEIPTVVQQVHEAMQRAQGLLQMKV